MFAIYLSMFKMLYEKKPSPLKKLVKRDVTEKNNFYENV